MSKEKKIERYMRGKLEGQVSLWGSNQLLSVYLVYLCGASHKHLVRANVGSCLKSISVNLFFKHVSCPVFPEPLLLPCHPSL